MWLAAGALIGAVAFAGFWAAGWLLGRADAYNGFPPPSEQDWMDEGGYDRM